MKRALLLAATLQAVAVPANAYTISGGSLVEDFTTIDGLDATASTGLWNIVSRAAEATRVANAQVTRPIAFGDGSDGIVSSSSGYTFDTDARPNGYNFISLSITGGTVTVRGRSPLVIRSLSTVTITPTIDLSGANGTAGTANGGTAAVSGGGAVTCYSDGGSGGDATPSNGTSGKRSDGTADTAGGAAVSGAAACAEAGSPGAAVPSVSGVFSTFDTSGSFICGASGAGGGGHRNGGNFSTGGGGGGGGGTVRITAAGNLTVGTIIANGGNGGAKATDTHASGAGSGGNGGAIWLQTLATLSTGATPTATGGAAGDSFNSGTNGFIRGDGPTRPAWAAAVGYDTTNVPASQTAIVQGRYDLGTTNAAFFTTPTITTTLNGGTVTTTYAGSQDNAAYSDFTSDLSSLSNRGFRYLKVRFAIANSGGAGLSPQVTQISIPITELDVRLMGGCGRLEEIGNRGGGQGPAEFAFWIAALLLGQRLHRKARRRVGIAGAI